MNKIESMYWEGIEDYFKTFKSDTFLFEAPFHPSQQIQVIYKDYDSGEEDDDDGVIWKTSRSIDIIVKGDSPNFHSTSFPDSITIMMGDCELWRHGIGNYNPDFMFQVLDEAGPFFAIDYHDKTKEQAAKDKQRDRFFTRNGFIPIRFAGTEVYRSPIDCVRETFQIIISILTLRAMAENRVENEVWWTAENYFKNNKEVVNE